jgi:hypothetical protein
MTLKLSGAGAEPKKLALLGLFIIIGIWVWYLNRTPSESTGSTRTTVTPGASPSVSRTAASRPNARLNRRTARGQSSLQEFRPSLKRKSGEEIDRSNIDPTLRLDLLEKLQNVKMEGGTRSLFEASSAPVELAKLVKEPPKVIPKIVGPMPAPAPVKPVEAPPPPIPLKFYGFISPRKSGSKRAFFLDGEDIIVATEGQLIKNRYKIVRIGVNSAVVEDTQVKNNQQTLPLVEEQTG